MRRAWPDESPKFGQVWGWGDADPPLMAISPADGPGPFDYRWRFLPLVPGGPAEMGVWYWFDFNGVVYDDWLRLDDD